LPSALDLSVESVSFYHNLAFVERGANRELSNRLPPHPRDRTFLALPAKARPAEPHVGPLRRAFRRAIPKPVRAALVRRLRGVAR
jgi:hypothetical protein